MTKIEANVKELVLLFKIINIKRDKRLDFFI